MERDQAAKWPSRPPEQVSADYEWKIAKVANSAKEVITLPLIEAACKFAIKVAKIAKRAWRATLAAGLPFFEPTWLIPGSSKTWASWATSGLLFHL
jgi:hypothetical protein